METSAQSQASSRKLTTSLVLRWVLAGPMAIIFAVVSMAAMPVWFPRGAAGVDHLAFALISLPAWWALAFFYVLLEENMPRAAVVLIAATLVKAAIAHSSGGW